MFYACTYCGVITPGPGPKTPSAVYKGSSRSPDVFGFCRNCGKHKSTVKYYDEKELKFAYLSGALGEMAELDPVEGHNPGWLQKEIKGEEIKNENLPPE